MLNSVDDLSSGESIDQAVAAISAAADSVRREAERQMSTALVRATSQFRYCRDAWKAELSAIGLIEEKLKSMPAVGVLASLMAALYLIAAFAGFRVEEILTGALAYLLNLKANDPRAIWMGVAFASSLLLFEVLIVRLRLLDDPWPLFRAATAKDAADRGKWARSLAGATIIAALLGTGALQLQSIAKMAPTREQAMILKKNVENSEAPPLPIDERVVRDAVLWFSICVLISSGYLAAVGVHDLKHCSAAFHLRFYLLTETVKRLEAARKKLDEVAAPALAGELAANGLPYSWLLRDDLSEMKLESLLEVIATAPSINEAAEKEAQVYEAQQRHNLENARAHRRTPRPALERVDLMLGDQGM